MYVAKACLDGALFVNWVFIVFLAKDLIYIAKPSINYSLFCIECFEELNQVGRKCQKEINWYFPIIKKFDSIKNKSVNLPTYCIFSRCDQVVHISVSLLQHAKKFEEELVELGSPSWALRRCVWNGDFQRYCEVITYVWWKSKTVGIKGEKAYKDIGHK